MEETTTIRWLYGVTRIHRETRVEGHSIVFGYSINGGPFKESVRLVFSDEQALSEGMKTLNTIG